MSSPSFGPSFFSNGSKVQAWKERQSRDNSVGSLVWLYRGVGDTDAAYMGS